MKQLLSLLENLNDFLLKNCSENPRITNLTHDSRTAKAGSLFFVLKGEKSHGKMFVLNAIAQGASAIVTDEELDFNVPQVIVKDTRLAMALMAKSFYENACDDLIIVGITGTNGKTTTARMITHLLRETGHKTISIGTLGVDGLDLDISSLTTPDPIELHKIFLEAKKAGVTHVAMESSAHAIHLKKLAGITFKVGIFTNLTIDHLDFFGDFRKYADTKINWFDENIATAIVNIDDPEGCKITELRGGELNTITYTLPSKIKLSEEGSSFEHESLSFQLPLAGKFNVYNAQAAILAAKELGIPLKNSKNALSKLPQVPGRFNTIKVKNATVVIDYAHSPDSLEKIILTCREISKGRIITLFGCGGNRDIGKRPMMGELATRLSDITIITTDNPREESPQSIMLQIEAGAKLNTNSYCLIENRSEAIKFALEVAQKGDLIIIAGKGAEPYMEIRGKRHPFSDYEEVEKFLQNN